MSTMKQPPADPKQHPTGNAVKDPHDWTTGDEPMTGAQASYLKTLSEEAGQPFDETLTKADASLRIEELKGMSSRGQDVGAGDGEPGASDEAQAPRKARA